MFSFVLNPNNLLPYLAGTVGCAPNIGIHKHFDSIPDPIQRQSLIVGVVSRCLRGSVTSVNVIRLDYSSPISCYRIVIGYSHSHVIDPL